jgi:glycosyltransferase involved in cell wall biosynthesis
MTAYTHDLSVVIISRNEERNIAGCIESVLRATKDIDNPDILLVDSASTDRTIEIAINYPIRILQLNPAWLLSASAGRYIGFLNARGEYIHFQDGDGTVYENWFKNALPVLKRDDHIAGVVGIITQEPYPTKTAMRWIEANKPEEMEFGYVGWFAGDSTLKKSILSEIGPFNPYLKSGEEGELCSRIISAGYRLLMLPHHMMHHYGYHEDTNTLDRVLSARYQGQILRYAINDKKIFWLRLKEYKFKLISAFLIVFGFLSAGVFLSSGNRLPWYIMAGGIIFYFGCVLYEIRDIKCAIYRAASQTLKAIPFIWGFLQPKKDPEKYPTDVKVIG